MPAPACHPRVALLPLVLVAGLLACRTSDNPRVCTAKNLQCPAGERCDLPTERCVPDRPDVGRTDGPTDGGTTGPDGPADAADAGCTVTGCPTDRPICAPTGRCVLCLEASHCAGEPNRPACVDSTCVSCLADPSVCARNPATPLCSAKGACVECNTSRECNQPTAPICVDGKCTRCTADSQCQERDGDDPGLCLSHLDGRCATDAEVIYVRNSACDDAGTGMGTANMPLCHPRQAIELVSSERRILLLRGPNPLSALTVRAGLPGTAGGPISVIGQAGASIVPGADVGVQVLGGDVYLRDLTISESKKEGVVVQDAATVRLNRCVIKLNAGGLRATGGAGFEVVNSIFHANQMGMLPGPILFGAAYLGAPEAGRPGVFRFNTVIQNVIGVVCANETQQLSSVLFYENGRDPLGDAVNCASVFSVRGEDPKFDTLRPYELTKDSPCLDMGHPTDHPPDDWKGEPRPGGMRSDCGADELQPAP